MFLSEVDFAGADYTCFCSGADYSGLKIPSLARLLQVAEPVPRGQEYQASDAGRQDIERAQPEREPSKPAAQ
jgi:hypothetical protein